MTTEILTRRGDVQNVNNYDEPATALAVTNRKGIDGSLSFALGMAQGTTCPSVGLTECGLQMSMPKVQVKPLHALSYLRFQNTYFFKWLHFDSFKLVQGATFHFFFVQTNTQPAPVIKFDGIDFVFPIGYANGVVLREQQLRTDFLYELTLINGVYRIMNCGLHFDAGLPILHTNNTGGGGEMPIIDGVGQNGGPSMGIGSNNYPVNFVLGCCEATPTL